MVQKHWTCRFLAPVLATVVWSTASAIAGTVGETDTFHYYYGCPDTNVYAIHLNSTAHRAGLTEKDTVLLVHWYKPDPDSMCLSENLLRVLYPDAYALVFKEGEGISAPWKGYNYFVMKKDTGVLEWSLSWKWTGVMREDKPLLCGAMLQYLSISFEAWAGGFTEPRLRIIYRVNVETASVKRAPAICGKNSLTTATGLGPCGVTVRTTTSSGAPASAYTLDGRVVGASPAGSSYRLLDRR